MIEGIRETSLEGFQERVEEFCGIPRNPASSANFNFRPNTMQSKNHSEKILLSSHKMSVSPDTAFTCRRFSVYLKLPII